MALTADDLQNVAQEEEGGPAFVYHVNAVDGLDVNDGKSWQTPKQTLPAAVTHAAANFANKPVAIWFNRPHTGLTSAINFQTTNLGPVKLRGWGRNAYISGFLENGPLIRANTYSEFQDFRIVSTAGANQFSYLIGDIGTSIQRVSFRNVIFDGTTDGTYFTGATSDYDVFDSWMRSQWDNFYQQNGATGRFWRTLIETFSPHQMPGANAHVQGIGQCNGGTAKFFDCALSFNASNSDAARTAYGILAINGGVIELHGDTSVIAKVPNGALVDLEATTGSEIRVGSGVSFNYARSIAGSAGSITLDYSYADAKKWSGSPVLLNPSGVPYTDVKYSNDLPVSMIAAPLPSGLLISAVQTGVNFASSVGGVLRPITVFENTDTPFVIRVVDGTNAPINLAGHTVNFIIHPVGSVTATSTIACTLSQSDPSGYPGVYDQINVTVPHGNVATSGNFEYKVRDTTAFAVYASGAFNVKVAP